MKTTILAVLLVSLSLVYSCGGGGGKNNQSPSNPTSAVLTLGTQGTSTNMGGLGVTVVLPPGVTVKTDAAGNVDGSVVASSGVAAGQATVISLYTPATTTTKAKVSIALAGSAAAGFGVGEFATVACIVDSGSPAEGDFSLENFQAVDVSGVMITGVSATLRVVIQ